MNMKLAVKVMMLVLGLLVVLVIRNSIGSKGIADALSSMFGANGPNNTLNWCADHVVDFAWLSDKVPAQLKEKSVDKLRNSYCQLKTEAISGVDLGKVQWEPLAESAGATGKKSVLEWNVEAGVFRSGGMPFKSSEFAKELSP